MSDEIVWNPPVERGVKVMVHQYWGANQELLTEPVERTASNGVDSDGDLPLTADGTYGPFYAKKWTKAVEVEAEPEPDGIEWNPSVPSNATVWVYRDSSMNSDMVNPRGFDIREVINGTKDDDGEILLKGALVDDIYLGAYARKWRLPDENPRPQVNDGAKVKVLGCLSGAADFYVKALMGKVVTVSKGTRHEGDYPIAVHLPDGLKVDGFTTGSISEWAVIEDKIPSDGKVEEVTNWGEVVTQWRQALHDYACEKEWCEEYEELIGKLFGWEDERGADFDVIVRLTRERWLSDLANNICYDVFDGERDEDRWDLDDQRIDINATITVTVTSKNNTRPDEDEVREYLDEQDFEYDELYIVDYNRTDF